MLPLEPLQIEQPDIRNISLKDLDIEIFLRISRSGLDITDLITLEETESAFMKLRERIANEQTDVRQSV